MKSLIAKKKTARVNNGWSGKSKQTARRTKPKTPSQQRKADLADERSQIALEKSVARELANAAKFREKDGPMMERRKTRGSGGAASLKGEGDGIDEAMKYSRSPLECALAEKKNEGDV